MRLHGQERQLYDLFAPRLEAEGYELVRVKLSGKKGGKGRLTLQIMIDRLGEETLTVGDCQKVSRQLSIIMDVEDPIKDAYVFEVSSPGIDRPLTKIAHFEHFVGHDLVLKTFMAYDGQRRFQGKLIAVEEGETIVLSAHINGENAELHFPFADIESAKLIPEGDDATQKGSKKNKSKQNKR